MSLARSGRRQRGIDYWPGFVDALSTLLLAIMFLLSVFVLAQFLLSREISGKDEVLNRLNSQINELTQLLSLERASAASFPVFRRAGALPAGNVAGARSG
jgi:chemotaxis protein MotB